MKFRVHPCSHRPASNFISLITFKKKLKGYDNVSGCAPRDQGRGLGVLARLL